MTTNALADLVLIRAVTDATALIRLGRPGKAEYVLTRATYRAEAILEAQARADAATDVCATCDGEGELAAGPDEYGLGYRVVCFACSGSGRAGGPTDVPPLPDMGGVA